MKTSNEAKDLGIHILKSVWRYLLVAIVAIILFHNCLGINKQIPKTDNKTFNLITDSIKDGKNKVVYLDTHRVKEVTKYHTILKTIHLTDTVKIAELITVMDSVIVIDSLEIGLLKTVNDQYARALNIKMDEIKRKDHAIDSLVHSHKKYWKGFKHGFVSGSVITEALNLAPAILK